MDEQTTELVQPGSTPEPAANENRGRFRVADSRINRKGRPVGLDKARRQAMKGQPLSGKLKTVFFRESDLCQSLTCDRHVWLENLPWDFRLVDLSLDRTRGGVIFTIYSESFALIQAGDPIPELQPSYNGLKWRGLR